MWYIHTMQYYSAIKMNEVLIHDKMWMNLENIMLGGEARYKTPQIILFHI